MPDAHIEKAKTEAARVLYFHEGSEWANDERGAELAEVVVPAVEPHIWRAVAAWTRDTCEQYDDGRLCDECRDRSFLIDAHADKLAAALRGADLIAKAYGCGPNNGHECGRCGETWVEP